MLKRTVSALLALCMALSLAACSGGGNNSNSSAPSSDTFSTDLSAFYEGIFSDAEEAPMMMELTDDLVEATYPGLGAVECKQSVLYTAAISAVACEVAMVEVVNASDVETVKDIFQARIDSQVAGAMLYPATIEQWQNNAKIVVRDNYVCLFVVSEELGSPADDFNTL